jgi:hypothetical protein
MAGGPKLTSIPIDCAVAVRGNAVAVKSIATARKTPNNFVNVLDRRTIVSNLCIAG